MKPIWALFAINALVVVCTTAIVLGGWWLGMGGWSFLGFLLLLAIHSPKESAE